MPSTYLSLELSVVTVALLGAVAYGSGDFMGGRAALRLSPSGAVAIAQCVAMLVTIQVFLEGGARVPGIGVVSVSVVGGVAYAAGLLFLYQGIAHGRVGVVAPVCGVVGILVPLSGDITLERHIGAAQFAGIAVCACAIVLLSGTPEPARSGLPRHYSLRLGVLSGMGYGTADLCLGILKPQDGDGGLMIARTVAAGIAIGLLVRAFLRERTVARSDTPPEAAVAVQRLAWVRRPHWMAMLPAAALAGVAGVFDSLGHMSYVHVATQGSMAVASALVALFPAVVVVLAVVILRERIVGLQYAGLAASAAGVLVMSM
jgi:drug/metabolite transporter (DMT)-like permease